MKKEITIALAGNPNSGKTSLFNALTGLNQKVSNFPGTTVDKKTGYAKISDTLHAKIIDLPGTYSLYPKSADEIVTYDLLRNNQGINSPDMVLFIADASNLKRNLLLLTQIADLGVPVTLALNMNDIAEKRGIVYDLSILSHELGIPVISINARQRKGIDKLKEAIVEQPGKVSSFFTLEEQHSGMLEEIAQASGKKNHYAALQFAINVSSLNNASSATFQKLFSKYHFNERTFQEKEILARYHTIDSAVRNSRKEKQQTTFRSLTKKADRILIHRFWGIAVFLILLFLVFQAVFSWSAYPMDWVELGFGHLSDLLNNLLPDGILKDLLLQGVLAGLGGVLVFLPQIIILFAFIAVLEDVGYMARVGFIMDRIMRPFGMNGKSVVPLISGMACAIPSIMATRSIENKTERLITILVTPLMSCSARLPVYTLLIGMLLPGDARWGAFNLHGVVLMALYLLGFVAALISAFVFKFIIRAKTKNYFIMELPSYKLPVASTILLTLYDKGKAFVWGAGKIIVAVSIVLWALASFGPGNELETIDTKYKTLLLSQPANADELETKKSAEMLQASYAGVFGRWIEPVIKPLGFDWKIGIALLTSLAAREVFVGTMNTIYSVGGNVEQLDGIRQKMMAEINPETGLPVFSVATLLSLLVFYAFAMQCMSTLSVVRAETRRWKWAIVQLLYMTGLAYFAALVTFQVLK